MVLIAFRDIFLASFGIMQRMQFEIITDFDQIQETEWDGLLSNSSFDSPFLRYGYQRAWWGYKGGGEWPRAELRVITARQDGTLTGIAPLFVGEKDGKKEMLFIGSIEISDYLDFIVQPENAKAFIFGVLDLIADNQDMFPPDLRLVNLPDASPSGEILKAVRRQDGWDIQISNAYHTPKIPLTEDWDTYLAGIDKKQRHEIRRKIRRAEGAEEDQVGWYITDLESSYPADGDAFLGLMDNDEAKAKFLEAPMRDQMREIMDWAANSGYLQLSFLTVNGKKAAGYLCLDYGDRIWVYNSGYAPGFRYYSPGWVLLGYLIQKAIADGKRYFDFMRGDEEYKYRFGAEDSFVLQAIGKLTRS